jgi:hypothetical protein
MREAREREMEDEERKEKERSGVATFKIQNESQINLLKCASFLIIFSAMLLYNFFNCVKKLKKKHLSLLLSFSTSVRKDV